MVPVHARYLASAGIGVHNPPAAAAEPLDALLVVVLAALSLAPLVVAHYVLSASIAHASNLHFLVELLDAGEHGGCRSCRCGATYDEPAGLRGTCCRS